LKLSEGEKFNSLRFESHEKFEFVTHLGCENRIFMTFRTSNENFFTDFQIVKNLILAFNAPKMELSAHCALCSAKCYIFLLCRGQNFVIK